MWKGWRLAMPYEGRFVEFVPITPYATFFRYPGITIGPDRKRVRAAILAATGIYEFTLSLLPVDALPEI